MNKYQDILKQWKVPEGKPTQQAWAELESKINSRNTERKVIAFSWKPMVSVAAAAALIIGLVLGWPNEALQTVACADGQTQVVTLPDASIATLNAGSTLSYSDHWDEERTVELKGQAFFEVTKGSRFQVVTPSGVVEVLGTSFDVYSRDSDFKVACKTGRVRVSAGKQSVEIAPGFVAVLENNKLLVGEFDLSQSDWRNGEFIYNQTQLSNVFEELSRQFNVRFQTPDFTGRLYTGRFSNKNLEEALQLVCLPMGLKYTLLNQNEIRIEDAQVVK